MAAFTYDVLHEISAALALKWDVHYRIALGTAQGLSYLRLDCNPAIVHYDIKPQNILLDSEMEPHISDFGIAKLMDQRSVSNHSISVAGTTGCISPENAFSTIRRSESDVYSCGIVLLEWLTRKKLLDTSFSEGMEILRWAWSSSAQYLLMTSLIQALRRKPWVRYSWKRLSKSSWWLCGVPEPSQVRDSQ